MNSELEALIQEARHPATPFERLKALVKHPEVEVRRALLDNPNVCPTDEDGKLDTSLLEALAEAFPEEVAEHPTFVLHALIEPDEAMEWVVEVVMERTKEVGLIETLFRTWGPHSWKVRVSVAKNPTTPEDALRLLGNEVTESSWLVRQSVAENPNTPQDTLRSLGNPATEPDWEVRASVARNPNTPPDVLRTLGNEETESEGDVRQGVAANRNTPEDTLRILGNPKTESDWLVREAAKKALVERGLP